MEQIRVLIRDHTGSKPTPVVLPASVTMRELIPVLVTKMRLPTTQGGQPLPWGLDHLRTGRRLRDEETLTSAGVAEDDVLELMPIVTAGCFLSGTQVTLPDRTSTAIERLSAGDVVLTFDTARDVQSKSRIAAVYHGTAYEYLVINQHLTITDSHPVKVGDAWVPAGELEIGNQLCTPEDVPVVVETIEHLCCDVPQPIYNLHLEEGHTFYANGILVHNAQSKALPFGEPLRVTLEDIVGRTSEDEPRTVGSAPSTPLQLLRITREEIDGAVADEALVSKWSLAVYALVILAFALGLWATRRTEPGIALLALGFFLSGVITLYAGRLVVLGCDSSARISSRAAMLLFIAFFFLTLELLLAILVN